MAQKLIDLYSLVGNQDSDLKIISNTYIKKGEVIKKISLVSSPQSFATVQSGLNEHILDEMLAATNHSCSPNSFVDFTKEQIIAERDIAPGEEITFFYPSTEWRMVRPFQCMCGSPNCIGTISGAENLPIRLFKNYKFNRHIKQKIIEMMLF
ncbi:SET domain-containing protein-lysine N-methyltransferase [Planktothrix sp. FACHB-1355]|uniref:SET domain-containing protein-lysine N-methyltransferase n=1 Tax=Aerosakkonema funiforme FACHB-1375 TaxID=2949571 RepID=A0A926VKX1_9CYAN|nr:MULTISPECIES: SET domain-containing protein-lysine N-methyltransferase [Oscillatoriales]MBD2184319.1 SET domain-containing protein-lysine N-methyltransferase [Aerosakkonema funiforme FACHB-1375]MBD3560481.1 SET domain-containing protein-lysine N-methyltransferase [Planktothrix sp. FACHB-1355]